MSRQLTQEVNELRRRYRIIESLHEDLMQTCRAIDELREGRAKISFDHGPLPIRMTAMMQHTVQSELGLQYAELRLVLTKALDKLHEEEFIDEVNSTR